MQNCDQDTLKLAYIVIRLYFYNTFYIADFCCYITPILCGHIGYVQLLVLIGRGSPLTNVAVEPLAYHMLAGHESSQPDRDSNHHGEGIRHFKLQVNRLAKGFPQGESKSFHQR